MYNYYVPDRFKPQVDKLIEELRAIEKRAKAYYEKAIKAQKKSKKTPKMVTTEVVAHYEREVSSPHTPYYIERVDDDNNNSKRIKKSLDSASKGNQDAIPSLEEVQSHIDKKGLTTVTAEQFVEWYEEHGWCTGGNHKINNWRSILNGWERRNKHREEEMQASAPRTKASKHDGTQDPTQEFTDWLEEELPLPSAEDNAYIVGFMKKYAPERWEDFRQLSAFNKARKENTPSMARLLNVVGENAVLNVVSRLINALAESTGTLRRYFSLQQTKKLAHDILNAYGELSMPDLIFAYHRCVQGDYGDFGTRLTHQRLMKALKAFCKWRREYCMNNPIQ